MGIEAGLVYQEEKELSQFFGTIFPDLKWDSKIDASIRILEKIGIRDNFQPVFLPDLPLLGVNYPGLKRPISTSYWGWVNQGIVDNPQISLGGSWVLCETTPKPAYKKDYDPKTAGFSDGEQLYSEDFLDGTLVLIREGYIKLSPHVPERSRFGYSHKDVTQIILPKAADMLGLNKNSLRIPTALEYNYLANRGIIGGPSSFTAEWMQETVFAGKAAIFGGYERGGLSGIGYKGATARALETDSGNMLPWIGFRLIISQ